MHSPRERERKGCCMDYMQIKEKQQREEFWLSPTYAEGLQRGSLVLAKTFSGAGLKLLNTVTKMGLGL